MLVDREWASLISPYTRVCAKGGPRVMQFEPPRMWGVRTPLCKHCYNILAQLPSSLFSTSMTTHTHTHTHARTQTLLSGVKQHRLWVIFSGFSKLVDKKPFVGASCECEEMAGLLVPAANELETLAWFLVEASDSRMGSASACAGSQRGGVCAWISGFWLKENPSK